MKLLLSDDFLKKWDITFVASNKSYAIVIDEDRSAGPFSTEYTLKSLSISRWWLIRKIQLWAIKKAFK